MSPPDPTVTRFAPSPTGYLHLGHAYSALFAYEKAGKKAGQAGQEAGKAGGLTGKQQEAPGEAARPGVSPENNVAGGLTGKQKTGGRFLLRIEDIDQGRARPEFEAAISEDLKWLGLDWPEPVRRQSEHIGDHQTALMYLEDQGLLYPCFCTRKEILAEIEDSAAAPHMATGMGPAMGLDGPVYPGTCRGLSMEESRKNEAEGRPYALRLDMAAAVARAAAAGGPLTWTEREKGTVIATPEIFGDVVLARKDTPTSYHLAVTIDDHIEGVTLVTRADDLFPATHIHRLLQELLRLETPEYQHHRLLTTDDGERLAKRDQQEAPGEAARPGVSPENNASGAEGSATGKQKLLTIRALREAGKTPEEVRAMAGFGETS